MNNILIVLTIAISLSMDAFSVSIGLASSKIKPRYYFILIVGIYHFIMPLLGHVTSNKLISNIFASSHIIVGIIFILIGLNMLIEIDKEETNKKLNLVAYLVLGLSVSLDSFATGIGIKLINSNMFINCLIFSITSMLFTFIGLKLGNKLDYMFGKLANTVGCIILVSLGIYYLVF